MPSKPSLILITTAFFLLAFSCSQDDKEVSIYDTLPMAEKVNECDSIDKDSYGTHEDKGIIDKELLPEVSGVVSASLPGHYWMINDSGNDAKLFLVDLAGKIKVVFELEHKLVDWEDIAICGHSGSQIIYIADTGNNKENRDKIGIISLEESVCLDMIAEQKNTDKGETQEYFLADSLFTYHAIDMPERLFDSEALFCDPQEDQLYMITKREKLNIVFKLELGEGDYLAKPILRLPYFFTTGSDISTDGRMIIMKNYHNIFLWERDSNETVQELLLKEPICLDYIPEPQGEAICFDGNTYDFITVSEYRDKKDKVFIRKYEYKKTIKKQ